MVMRTGIFLSYAGGFREAVDDVVELEKIGIDIALVAEAYSYDAISQLGYLAAKTSRIELGTGVVPIYIRTPSLLAMTTGLAKSSNSMSTRRKELAPSVFRMLISRRRRLITWTAMPKRPISEMSNAKAATSARLSELRATARRTPKIAIRPVYDAIATPSCTVGVVLRARCSAKRPAPEKTITISRPSTNHRDMVTGMLLRSRLPAP